MYILSYSTTVVLGYGVIILHCFFVVLHPSGLKKRARGSGHHTGPTLALHPCRGSGAEDRAGQRGLPGSWKPAEEHTDRPEPG